jgi:hypothetical protein
MAAIMRWAASGSAQRTGLLSTSSRRSHGIGRASSAAAAADPKDVAAELHARGREQRLGQSATGHPRRRLAGAGALQYVAQVVGPELQRAGQVRVSRAAAARAGAAAGRRRAADRGT